MELHPDNIDNIEKLHSAIAVLCLDEKSPKDSSEVGITIMIIITITLFNHLQLCQIKQCPTTHFNCIHETCNFTMQGH